MELFGLNIHFPVTDPTWIFFLVLIIILFAPMILGRLRIPHIIGMILAGVLVGKYGFNILERDSSFELFGKVGLYYIMFLAGLEMDMDDFKKNKTKGLVFGLFTFLIPMALGIWSSMSLLDYGLVTSILLASMYASHTLIAYPIISRYGLSRQRTVSITIGGTAVTVVLALMVLAVIGGMYKGEDVGGLFWAILLGKVLALFGLIIFLCLASVGGFQNIRGCGNAVCLCLGYGVLRGWTDGAGRNGRYFGCFSCRFGTEPFCSSCFSVDESVGVCR